MIWQPANHRWQQALAIAQRYHAAHGELRVGQDVVWGDLPFNLGHWLIYAREQHAKGSLEPDQTAALDALNMPWSTLDTPPASGRGGRPAAESRPPREVASRPANGETDDEDWLSRLDQLCEYQADHHGALPTPAMSGMLSGDPPTDLFAFLEEQRRRLRQGELTGRQITLLDTLGRRWRAGTRS